MALRNELRVVGGSCLSSKLSYRQRRNAFFGLAAVVAAVTLIYIAAVGIENSFLGSLMEMSWGNAFRTSTHLWRPNGAFDDVLLIVNFGWPSYLAELPFVRCLFGQWFPNIVLTSDSNDTDEAVYVPQAHGTLGYYAAAEIMRRFPGYRRYLFTNHDVLLMPQKFAPLDPNRFWLTAGGWNGGPSAGPMDVRTPNPPDTYWWHTKQGNEAMRKVYEEMDEQARRQHDANVAPWVFEAGMGDTFHVPARHRERFIELATLYHKHSVFIEFAVCGIFTSIENKSEIVSFSGYEVLGVKKRKHVRKLCKNTFLAHAYCHPIKPHDPENRMFAQKMLGLYSDGQGACDASLQDA